MNIITNLRDRFTVKRHHIICEEVDLVKVLKAIDENHYCCRHSVEMSIGNCGWVDETKWYVHFNASDLKWDELVCKLNIVRVWGNRDIPDHFTGQIYSTD